MRSGARFAASAALLAWAVGAGCSTRALGPDAGGDAAPADADPADCPNDLPSSCPAPAPTYDGDGGVASLVHAHCVPCHSPGGIEPSPDFTTYAGLFAERSAALDQVYACTMPQADGGVPLAPAERATLLAWFVCGAPKD
jgi:hypothetical protein